MSTDGKKRKLSIVRTVKDSWKRVGLHLGIPDVTLQAWDEEKKNPEECCRCVFQYWIDNRCEDYETNWDGVVSLLDDLDFDEDVIKLQEFLKAQ